MKLPDFSLDERLNQLRMAMGAPLVEFVAKTYTERLAPDEIERLAKEGIDIPLDQVRVLTDGTLAYKNQRVVVYIRDVKQYRNYSPRENGLPRFHVSHCDKLQEMRSNNRYERYVVSTRESGTFQINLKRHGDASYRTSDERLKVCQLCLAKLNWDRFIELRASQIHRTRIVEAFDLAHFFERFSKTFIVDEPKHTDKTSPLNEYSPKFKIIADAIKHRRGYRCDECDVDLSKHRKFLHAHHKNGNQSDDRENNIAILCILHHSMQPYHQHMKADPALAEFRILKAAGAIPNAGAAMSRLKPFRETNS